MGVYEDLVAAKTAGVALDLSNLSPGELKSLFIDEHIPDSMIADLYRVSKSKVTYLRRKHGVTIRKAVLDDLLTGGTGKAREKNIQLKTDVWTKANINMIAKAITHFAFRNGPVEDMHSMGQLSESDMKTLNKFMVNRLAYVFGLLIDERWLEFAWLVSTTDHMFGAHWDNAQPDDGGTRELIEMILKGHSERIRGGTPIKKHTGTGDYSRDRNAWLDALTVDDIVKEAEKQQD